MMQRVAVLVGNGEFPDEPDLATLRGPANDVQRLAAVLADPTVGRFDRVISLVDARNDVVLTAVEDVLGTAERDDLVLLYYSGHGRTDRKGQLYLAALNTQLRRLYTTSVPAVAVKTLIDNSNSASVIWLLDCCYSGAVGELVGRGAVAERLSQDLPAGVHVMTSSTSVDTSIEREHGAEDGWMGDFTRALVAGLTSGEADADADGVVRMQELKRYLEEHVRHQKPQYWALRSSSDPTVAWRAPTATTERDRARAIEVAMRNALGTQYAIRATIGRDPTAPTYLAYDAEGGRPLTFRVLPLGMRPSAESDAWVERIAARVLPIDHQHLARVHAIRRVGPHAVVAAKYVEGRSVREVLADEGAVPVDVVQVVLGDLASALSHLHASGLAHGDVRPETVILGVNGQAVLIDVARAHLVEGAGDHASPLVADATCSPCTPATDDQHALGRLAYEMLVGRVLQDGSPLLTHVRPDCPASLAGSIARMLAPDVVDRWPSFEAMTAALGQRARPTYADPRRAGIRRLATAHRLTAPHDARSPHRA